MRVDLAVAVFGMNEEQSGVQQRCLFKTPSSRVQNDDGDFSAIINSNINIHKKINFN